MGICVETEREESTLGLQVGYEPLIIEDRGDRVSLSDFETIKVLRRRL